MLSRLEIIVGNLSLAQDGFHDEQRHLPIHR